MVEQNIELGRSTNATITQVAGDINQFIKNSFKLEEKPIYFSYGDSDVQLFLYKVGINLDHFAYYQALEEAFKLLAIFKPISTPIVIAASSIFQSDCTYKLYCQYHDLWKSSIPHLVILRKEAYWNDYIEKRRENSKNLIKIPRYTSYYNNNFFENLEDCPSISSDILAGRGSADKWATDASKILSSSNSGKELLTCNDLIEISNNILVDSIFVWEELEKNLLKLGLNIANCSNNLKSLLIKSYLGLHADRFYFPTGISLRHDFSINFTATPWYIDIKLLRLLTYRIGLYDDIMQLSPLSLANILESDGYFEFKSILNQAENNENLLVISNKYRHLLTQAVKANSSAK